MKTRFVSRGALVLQIGGLFIGAAYCFGGSALAQAPAAQITNGTVTAKLLLPDPRNGYYRGTRFDWSGVISSLQVKGKEYFGQWFDRYDPKLHDAIQGPAEEFGEVGYAEAPSSGLFLRIGVGMVRKPKDETEYQRFRTYEIVNGGLWIVRPSKDRVEFVHEVKDSDGYGYRYEKTVRLEGRKPQLVIEHKLKNLGTKAIETWQYNHNFFMMEGQPTGEGVTVRTGFDLKASKPFADGAPASAAGREISYQRDLRKGESVYAEFEGSSVYQLVLEHRKAGTGVKITGDRPVSKLVYWSIRSTFCPEAYVDIRVAPGETTKWKYTYDFYELQP